jgi:phosphoglycolate phosphatase
MKGLIFDVDGTLVSLKVDGEKLRTTTSRELARAGFDVSFMEGTNLHTQEIIDRARQQVESGSVRIEFEPFRTALFAALDELEMGWNALAEPIEGTTDVLDRLRSANVKLATLTNSGRAPSDWLLKRHDLHRRFDFTLTRDDVAKLKPSPDGLLKALRMMGLPKGEVIYVGDSVIDVKAAKGAGMKIASVTTGRYTHERLRSEGSDYIVESLSALHDLV